jgi:hypothetical protein
MWIRTDREQDAKDALRRNYRPSGRACWATEHCGAGAVVDIAGRFPYGEGLRSKTDK